MHFRTLPGIPQAVSTLGLGTVKFGRNQSVKYPQSFDLPSDAEILTLLDQAREEGINLIDTAPAYGSSEERLGSLLGKHRDEWIIISKAGEEFENGQSFFDFSRKAISASIDRTLSRLRTDRVECLLLHSDGNDLAVLDHTDALESLNDAKRAGKILSIGISTKTVEGGLRAVELGMDAVMVTYNPWHREEESVLDSAAQSRKTGVLIKKAFGSGWFGKNQKSTDAHTSAVTAMRFVFEHTATTAAIIGTIQPAHLKDNCQSLRIALEERMQ